MSQLTAGRGWKKPLARGDRESPSSADGSIVPSQKRQSNGGTVFQLTPAAGGLWSESILHNFGQSDQDGNYPGNAGLILDTSGNLYGTTNYGGTYAMGTVFELTPAEGGSWAETILHRFGNGKDGIYPDASMIFDSSGNLCGTTTLGGADGSGTVFEIRRTSKSKP
jgi:hypothetical protein